MKRIFLFIFCVCVSFTSFAFDIKDIKGVWTSDNDSIVLTINDSILIWDEIGNEGDIFTYSFRNDRIEYMNSLNSETMYILEVTNDHLTYYFIDDMDNKRYIYTLYKK